MRENVQLQALAHALLNPYSVFREPEEPAAMGERIKTDDEFFGQKLREGLANWIRGFMHRFGNLPWGHGLAQMNENSLSSTVARSSRSSAVAIGRTIDRLRQTTIFFHPSVGALRHIKTLA